MIEAKLIDHMGSDLTVVQSARVSYGKRSEEFTDKDANLIKFLARGMSSKDFGNLVDEVMLEADAAEEIEAILKDFRNVPLHKSPFNHAFATFHCKGPIYVARQLVKHEYMPWNEISGRYVEFEPDFFVPEQFRSKATDKKQGSGEHLCWGLNHDARSEMMDLHNAAYKAYKRLLGLGVCEEQARGVLPLNLITEWYWSGSLGAIAKMCQHRIRTDAQEETRIIANQIDEQMKELFPVSWAALVHGEY
jgi:thymidylate synthase (FAD)